MRSIKARHAILLLAVVLAGTASAGIADAAPPVTTCGQVITTDWTLHNDVGPCPGNGIIVGADDITLNLRGHRISGNFDQGASGEFAGVRLPFRTGVTVLGQQGNARIEGFEAGVLINGGTANQIKHLTIQDNVGPSPFTEPELGDGIILFSSAGNRIVRNTLLRNGYYDGIGVLGEGSNANLIEDNSVDATVGDIDALVSGVGIIINPVIDDFTAGASIFDNQIIDNTVTNGTGQGISTSSSVNSVIRGNLVEGNGIGGSPGNGIGVRANMLATQLTNVTVEANTVRGNGNGIQLLSGGNRVLNNESSANNRIGIEVQGSRGTDNVISHNQVENNRFQGVALNFRVARNEVSDNSILNNGGAGVLLFGAGGGRILRNEVHGNGGSGIVAWAFASFTTRNELRDNNAADNMRRPSPNPFDIADLADTNPGCDANLWFGNIWGSGGFNQPCVTNGGHEASAGSPTSVQGGAVSQESTSPPSEGHDPGTSASHRHRPKS